MTEREDPPSPRLQTREAEIASTMPADLDALPRLRRFRLRGMDRVKASLTRWKIGELCC